MVGRPGPSQQLGQLPHGADRKHDLLPHRTAHVIAGLLLQQHLESTAVMGHRSCQCPASSLQARQSPGAPIPALTPRVAPSLPSAQLTGVLRGSCSPAVGRRAAPTSHDHTPPCARTPLSCPHWCASAPSTSPTRGPLTSSISASSNLHSQSCSRNQALELAAVHRVQTEARNRSFSASS